MCAQMPGKSRSEKIPSCFYFDYPGYQQVALQPTLERHGMHADICRLDCPNVGERNTVLLF